MSQKARPSRSGLLRRTFASTPGNRIRGWGIPVAVFLVGLVFTGVATTAAQRQRDARQAEIVEATLDVGERRLREAFQMPLEALHAFRSVFETFGGVERTEFNQLGEKIARHYPSVYAFEWLPYVTAAERPRFEQAARDSGLADFMFMESGEGGVFVRARSRSAYLPIYFMAPGRGAQVLGFDSLSLMEGEAVYTRARDSGEIVVSERFNLLEDTRQAHAVAAFQAVYEDGSHRTTAVRRSRFRGLLAVLFRIEPLVNRALSDLHRQGFRGILLDAAAKPELRVLFRSRGDLGGESVPEVDTSRQQRRFAMGDRQWSLHLLAGAPLSAGFPWDVMAWGLTVVILLAVATAAMLSALHQRRRVQQAKQLGMYTLTKKLGEGGMGAVYQAKHAMLRRPTAVKLMRPGKVSETAMERFEREVQTTASLKHPNTIAIYDYGRTDDGALYYVMEYVEGLTFETLVRSEGAQSSHRVIYLLRQICGALAEAHAIGLVHRDIKPANLMLTQMGNVPDFVKLLDFGLVKNVTLTDMGITGESSFVGTPLFAAPEMYTDPLRVEPRSDLYSLAAVAYYLLTGRHVFDAPNHVALMKKHLQEVPVPPSCWALGPVPADLEALILAALAKKPEDRPASAEAFLAHLDAIKLDVPWTSADAKKWWVERGLTLVIRRSPSVPLPDQGTLAVLLDERLDPTRPSARRDTPVGL